MALITRFTSRYDPREDRLRLTGSSQEGDVVSCLLTRRLLERLLRQLIKLLEAPNTEHAADQRPSSQGQEIRQELAQEAAQQQAQENLRPQKAVEAESDSAWLADAVDIRIDKGRVHLVFRDEQDQRIETSLNGEELRQWLFIVYQLWNKADWGKDLWPEWMQQDNAIQSASAALH